MPQEILGFWILVQCLQLSIDLSVFNIENMIFLYLQFLINIVELKSEGNFGLTE